MPNASFISLTLTHFRNHDHLRLEPHGRCVILTGPNGSGKTNVLEAVSLFSPGRGLRRARLRDMVKNAAGCSVLGAGGLYPAPSTEHPAPASWTLSATCASPQGEVHIGTARDGDSDRRIIRIDGKNVAQTALTKHLAILWQTPQMDGLFLGSGSDRRAFLDRLVYSDDAAHATRVNAYEKAMRDRNRLLAENTADAAWLEALEARMAAEGVAIAAAREHTIQRLNAAMQDSDTAFPQALLRIDCAVEDEAAFRVALARARPRDAAAGRALFGVHRAVVSAFHATKGREAANCSTGEQKAVLLSILLAHARACAAARGFTPILLLDEVVAHLDSARRYSLFAAIAELGAQAWLTGTDAADFSGLRLDAVIHDFALEKTIA